MKYSQRIALLFFKDSSIECLAINYMRALITAVMHTQRLTVGNLHVCTKPTTVKPSHAVTSVKQ